MGTSYVAYKRDEDQFELRQMSDLSPTINDTRLVAVSSREKLEAWLLARPSLLIRDWKEKRIATSEEIFAELDECESVKIDVP